jgi:hypothetical protein
MSVDMNTKAESEPVEADEARGDEEPNEDIDLLPA